MTPVRRAILAVLKELSQSDPESTFGLQLVLGQVDRARDSVSRMLSCLVEEGLLEKPSKSSYRLTQLGLEELAKLPD